MNTHEIQQKNKQPRYARVLAASFLSLFFLGAYLPTASAKSPPPPPPTKVWISDLRGVTATTGAFILEWSPAIIPGTQTPYNRYQLPGAGLCKFTAFPGDSIVPSASGTVIITTSVNRVNAVCPARYLVSGVRTAPPDSYTSGSTWLYTEKFLVPSLK